eukprot:2828407-Rhodomonas_salina.2
MFGTGLRRNWYWPGYESTEAFTTSFARVGYEPTDVFASSVLDIGGGAYQVGITASRAGQFTMVVQYNETQRGSAVLVSVPVTSFTLSVTSGGISAAGTSSTRSSTPLAVLICARGLYQGHRPVGSSGVVRRRRRSVR